ncbi:MAG: metallophosphoesterase [Clostridia bacterium]|nr:metallophosphoesterase [Clostridia bacterium]
MIKRIILLLLILALFASLFGCTSNTQEKKAEVRSIEQQLASSESKPAEKNTALSKPDVSNNTAVSSASNSSENPQAALANKTVSDSEPAQPKDTPKSAKPGETLRFIVMADSRGVDKGVNSKIVKQTLEQIKKLSPQPKFAVLPGDLVDGAATYAEVKSMLQYFKKITTAYYPSSFFFPGFGNHEARAKLDGEKAFSEVFNDFKANFMPNTNRTVYYFDSGNTRFYMLNSNHPGETHTISDKQLEWVKSNSDGSQKYNMFFFHEPAYPTGSHVGSALDSNRLQRNKLWQLIDGFKSPMVFVGHEHNYTRRHIDSSFNETVKGTSFKFTKSIYQVTVGSFGAPLYNKYTSTKNVDVPPVTQYHYSVVDIDDKGIKVTVYSVDGKIIDSFAQ